MSIRVVGTVDTENMSWIAQAVLGAIWAVCGVVIGVSPPLSETGRGRSSPVLGWLIVAVAVFLIVSAFRRAADPAGEHPAHLRARRAVANRPVKTLLALAICLLMGVGSVWWGMSGHVPAQVAIGAIALTTCGYAAPLTLDMLRDRAGKP